MNELPFIIEQKSRKDDIKISLNTGLYTLFYAMESNKHQTSKYGRGIGTAWIVQVELLPVAVQSQKWIENKGWKANWHR